MAEIFNSHYINITKKASGKKPFYSRLFSKCDHIRSFLRIWSHLLKKSLIESFIFCAVIDLIARSYLDHSSINRMKSTSKNEIPSITSSSNFCGTNAEKYLNFCVHLTQKSCYFWYDSFSTCKNSCKVFCVNHCQIQWIIAQGFFPNNAEIADAIVTCR